MLRYLKQALVVRPRVPLLGGVPVNLLAAVAFGILGVAHPGFWLLGAGLIGGFVLMLATSPRFQKVVDARDLAARDWQVQALEKTLASQLDPAARQRLERLDARSQRILDTYRQASIDLAGDGDRAVEDLVIDSTGDALKKLRWLYLKLLTAQANLQNVEPDASAPAITREIEAVRRDLDADRLSPAARQSRQATLALLEKRLENARRREHSLEEIRTDLDRIDAHIDLALDQARLKSQPAALSANIELASQLLDGGVFGDSAPMVLDLEQRLGQGGAA